MTEYDIQLIIIKHWYKSNNLILPNICLGYGEADVFRLTRAGYSTEFEIKITRQDFNNDKNKRHKHEIYNTVFKDIPLATNVPKSKKGIPNYFAYVVPCQISLTVADVPEYAGLYVVTDKRGLEQLKYPPCLHKEKHSDYWVEKIARSLNAKYLYHYFYHLEKYEDEDEI